MTPNTMTLDEVRDELARRDGWTLEEGEHHEWGPDDRSITTYPAVWIKGDDWITHHPHPATLDGAAAALPEGWVLRQVVRNNTFGWMCVAARVNGAVGSSEWKEDRAIARSEISARYRLALACRIAEEGK